MLIETILGRVRDGRDPLRAARALGRAQRRALGLHLQRHQEVPRPPGLPAARPRAGHDDRAVHARLHRAARQDLPQRGAHAIGGMAAFIPSRRDPEVNETRAGRRCARQAARGRRRLRRHLGRPPRPRAGRHARCSTRVLGERPNQMRRASGRTSSVDAPSSCSTSRVPGGAITEAGVRAQRQRRHPVHRSLAARHRRGRASTT